MKLACGDATAGNAQKGRRCLTLSAVVSCSLVAFEILGYSWPFQHHNQTMNDDAAGEAPPSRPARRGGVSVAPLAATGVAPSADKPGQRGPVGGEFQAMILRLRKGGVGGASTDRQMERSIITVLTLYIATPSSPSLPTHALILTLTRCVGSWPTGSRAAARSGAAAW